MINLKLRLLLCFITYSLIPSLAIASPNISSNQTSVAQFQTAGSSFMLGPLVKGGIELSSRLFPQLIKFLVSIHLKLGKH